MDTEELPVFGGRFLRIVNRAWDSEAARSFTLLHVRIPAHITVQNSWAAWWCGSGLRIVDTLPTS